MIMFCSHIYKTHGCKAHFLNDVRWTLRPFQANDSGPMNTANLSKSNVLSDQNVFEYPV